MKSLFISFVAAMVFLLAGCVTPYKEIPEEGYKAPNARLGPVIEVLKMNTFDAKARVILDNIGQGHVIVTSAKLKEVHHIVVGPEGVKEREVVTSSTSPRWVDAAFDREGSLHVLIDNEHLVKKEGKWRTVDRTPWKELGFKCDYAFFVKGAQGLLWAFEVSGKEFGTPWRWDFYGFASSMGGIIFPWPTTAHKLVMVPETEPAYTFWTVVDADDKNSPGDYNFAADARGVVTVVYNSGREGDFDSANQTQSRYVRFQAVIPPSDSVTSPATIIPFKGSRLLQKATGRSFCTVLNRDVRKGALAVDPETGTALFVQSHRNVGFFFTIYDQFSGFLCDGDLFTCVGPIEQRLEGYSYPMRLAPAGGNRFHAVTIGKVKGKVGQALYFAFINKAWSAPVVLGEARVSSPLLFKYPFLWDPVWIGSNGRDDCLVVWPVKEGIVARWISLVQ